MPQTVPFTLGTGGIFPQGRPMFAPDCLAVARAPDAFSYAMAAGVPSYLLGAGGWQAFASTTRGQTTTLSERRRLEVSRRILERQFGMVRTSIGKSNLKASSPKGIGVVSLSGMGGSGKVAREYAQAMAEAGHRTYLFCTEASFFPRSDIPDVSILRANVPNEPRAPDHEWASALADELCKSVFSERLDVLHVHYVAGLLDAALIARGRLAMAGKSIKVIATLHGSDVSNFGRNPAYGPNIARQLASCDGVSAVSKWLAAEAKEVFGLRNTPAVIWNSVDVRRFHPGQWSDLRREIAPDGERVLCHASNFRPVKRALDTVEIHARLINKGIPTRLLLMGKGPDVARAEERAFALGTHRYVTATGPLSPDVLAKHVAASDLALVTSSSESFSLAALEAMACGVPVVGTRCGGLEEVVDGIDWKADGASRLLAGVGDVDSMAKICADLLQSPKIYWSVQMQGMLAPLTRFHVDRQTEGYLNLLD